MIRLSPAQIAAIRAHGEETFPLECCGAVFGSDADDCRTILEVRRLENTFAPDPDFEASVGKPASEFPIGRERRFMVSPEAMLRLMREERETGRRVVGFYHSHPNHPAVPSEYDRVWAMPWYSYLIVSIMAGAAQDLTCWRLAADGARFDSEQIIV